jgi:hypothetical protein
MDLERFIARLSRCQVVRRIPCAPLPTLRRGVHLLVDRSEALIPYAADQTMMQDVIERVVGKDKTTVLNFSGTPLRGAGRGPRDVWPMYRVPPWGTPVVVLTDLGIGRPLLSDERASEEEWRKFAVLLDRGGCFPIALVPYHPDRWPIGLRPLMTIIQWDRDTSAASVQRALRARRGIKR